MSSFDMFGFFAPKENILPKEKKKFVCEPLVFADSVIIKEDLEKLSGYNSKCKVEKQTERLAQWFKILRNIFLMPFLLMFNMIRNMVTKKKKKERSILNHPIICDNLDGHYQKQSFVGVEMVGTPNHHHMMKAMTTMTLHKCFLMMKLMNWKINFQII